MFSEIFFFVRLGAHALVVVICKTVTPALKYSEGSKKGGLKNYETKNYINIVRDSMRLESQKRLVFNL